MKKTILFFLLISAFAIFAFCMEPLPVQMGGMYGFSNYSDEAATCLAETSSGGFIICGLSLPSDADWSHILVVSVDKDGKLIWSKEFGNFGSYVYAITKTQDNAFIMVGYSYEVGMLGAIAIKFDESGNLIWQKAFGPNAWAYNIKALSDGNYLLLGGMLNESRTKYFGLLIKMDKDGNVIWEKKGELGENLPAFPAFYGAIEHPEGGLLIWGSGFLIKYDDGGNIVWARKIYDPYISHPMDQIDIWDAIILQNGDIIASFQARNTDGQGTLVRLSKEGNVILWQKSIINENYPDEDPTIYKLIPRGNSKYFAFSYGGVIGRGHYFLVEFDENGNVDESAYYNDSPFTIRAVWGPLNPVVVTSDGNIAYCGVSDHDTEKSLEFGLMKTGIQSNNCTAPAFYPIIADSEAETIEIEDVNDLTICEINLLCSDLSGTDFARESSATGINSFCPVITQINKLQNPFRLEIIGSNFTSIGCGDEIKVTINGVYAPKVTWKNSQRLIVKKGDDLKNMLPKGVPVCIQIWSVDPDSGEVNDLYKSDCFYFTR